MSWRQHTWCYVLLNQLQDWRPGDGGRRQREPRACTNESSHRHAKVAENLGPKGHRCSETARPYPGTYTLNSRASRAKIPWTRKHRLAARFQSSSSDRTLWLPGFVVKRRLQIGHKAHFGSPVAAETVTCGNNHCFNKVWHHSDIFLSRYSCTTILQAMRPL